MSDKQDKLREIQEDKLREIQEELKWISLSENPTVKEKLLSRGIFNTLVPIGCLVTCGVLFTGIYNMYKGDRKNQQRLMRYRVLAQGITLTLATLGMAKFKFSS